MLFGSYLTRVFRVLLMKLSDGVNSENLKIYDLRNQGLFEISKCQRGYLESLKTFIDLYIIFSNFTMAPMPYLFKSK